MRRYRGPASEATAPTELVFSMREAVQSTTGAPPLSPTSPKSTRAASKQLSWHAQPINKRIDDERMWRERVEGGGADGECRRCSLMPRLTPVRMSLGARLRVVGVGLRNSVGGVGLRDTGKRG